jgi:glycosyltransferase involved in cell wall biosynthesis
VKIAYVGDFINHGKSLQTPGTSLVILLSLLEEVDSIDVICPEENEKVEKFELPQKVKLYRFYRYDDSISILRLLKIHWNNYDEVIFNMLPTGFGNGTLANAFALIVPVTLRIIFRQNNIKVIYHNSIFTNDIRALGYNSAFDRIRSFFLGVVERTLFKNVTTFVLLNLYKKRIEDSIGKNKLHVLNWRYLDAIATIYLNKVMGAESIEAEKTDIPTILMHGSWGPQKNIELGLMILKKLKREGVKFRLVISGGVNRHFPEYKRKFQELIHSYSDVIDEYLGPVTEKDIMKIFLDASLLILPYNTPGGFSGVLEQAIFFEVPTIAIDFPEFREQAMRNKNIVLTDSDKLSSELINKCLKIKPKNTIHVISNLRECQKNIEYMLKTHTRIFQ